MKKGPFNCARGGGEKTGPIRFSEPGPPGGEKPRAPGGGAVGAGPRNLGTRRAIGEINELGAKTADWGRPRVTPRLRL